MDREKELFQAASGTKDMKDNALQGNTFMYYIAHS